MKTIQVTFLTDHVMFLKGKRVHISARQQDRLARIALAKEEKLGLDMLDREIKAGRLKEPAPLKISIPSEYHDDFVKKGIIASSRKTTTKKKK